MAIGILKGLHLAGLHVPQEMSVTGLITSLFKFHTTSLTQLTSQARAGSAGCENDARADQHVSIPYQMNNNQAVKGSY